MAVSPHRSANYPGKASVTGAEQECPAIACNPLSDVELTAMVALPPLRQSERRKFGQESWLMTGNHPIAVAAEASPHGPLRPNSRNRSSCRFQSGTDPGWSVVKAAGHLAGSGQEDESGVLAAFRVGQCDVIHNVHSSCPRRPKDPSKGPQAKRGAARGAVAVGGCG